jgi:hypothetical protein
MCCDGGKLMLLQFVCCSETPLGPTESVNFGDGVLPNEAFHSLHSSQSIFGVFGWEVYEVTYDV